MFSELYELGKSLTHNNESLIDESSDITGYQSSIMYREQLLKEMNQLEEDVSESYRLLSALCRVAASESVLISDFMKVRLERAVNVLSIVMITSFIVLGMIVISLFIILRKRIVSPLGSLMKAISETGKGTRDVSINVETGDEFGKLSQKFNEMTLAVKCREESLLVQTREINRQKQEVERFKHYVEEVIHASPNTVITFDKDSRIVFANRKAQEISGEISIISGKRLSELGGVFSDYQSLVEEVITSVEKKTLLKQEVFNHNKQVFNIFIYPLSTEPGGGAVLEAEDITARVLMEEKMIESQKMETVGLLAGGFAHDFNNLLTGIIGYLELAKKEENSTKRFEYINRVLEISSTAAILVDQILLFSRTGPGKKESQPLDSSLSMIGTSIKKDIKIVKKIDDPEVCLYVNGAQIKQMLLNVIINALEVLGEKKDGEVVIEAGYYRRVVTDEKVMLKVTPQDRIIRIAVRDNGPGIPEDIKKHLFEPFFSTKVRGSTKGTGLGLSIVYQIVKNHDGEINIQSSQGKGTLVEILLPCYIPEKPSRMEEHFIPHPAGTILLVDDEEMVRNIEERMLKRLGYRVITLNNGMECIDYFSKKNRPPDLLIIDLVMPGLDGSETLKKLAQMGVRVPVLIASGYITLDMSYLKNYDQIKGILKKPFNMNELSKKLQES